MSPPLENIANIRLAVRTVILCHLLGWSCSPIKRSYFEQIFVQKDLCKFIYRLPILSYHRPQTLPGKFSRFCLRVFLQRYAGDQFRLLATQLLHALFHVIHKDDCVLKALYSITGYLPAKHAVSKH